MAKKSFKGNPALQFISAAGESEEEARRAISAGQLPKAPEGFKLNPVYLETRTRRLQLVLQPSLYEKIKAKATASGISVNELCHQILSEAMREESTDEQ